MRPESDNIAKPSLTIVVIPLQGGLALERSLRSLGHVPAHCIVVGAPTKELVKTLDLKGVEVIRSSASVPRRRALGVQAARTDWVAIIEDTCEITESWYPAFVDLSGGTQGDAWGGTVDIEHDLPPRCLALACLEYGQFTTHRWHLLATAGARSPWRAVSRLAGLNLVYRRASLRENIPESGLIETELHEHFLQTGNPLLLHPGLSVRYFAADYASATLRSRYAHGRIYGSGQRQRCSFSARFLHAAKCALLPLVLAARAAPSVPRSYRQKCAAAMWLIVLAGAWSLGECVGLLRGRGDSLRAWH